MQMIKESSRNFQEVFFEKSLLKLATVYFTLLPEHITLIISILSSMLLYISRLVSQ